MRLEESDYAAFLRFQRAQGGAGFFGVVSEIVNYSHPAIAGADHVETPGKPLETGQCHRGIVHAYARGHRCRDSGQRVFQVVSPRHGQAQRMADICATIHQQCICLVFAFDNRAGFDAESRLGVVNCEGDYFFALARQILRIVIVQVDDCRFRPAEEITEEQAQLLHALVIEADIQQHGHGGIVQRDGAVALVHFADEHVALAHDRAGERIGRAGEVLHHRAVHDRGLVPRILHDPAQHCSGGGFAAGTADCQGAGRSIEQAGKQFRARETGAAQRLRAHNFWHGILDSGTGDQHLFSAVQSAAILRE